MEYSVKYQWRKTMTKLKQYIFLFVTLVVTFIILAIILGVYFEVLSVTGGFITGYLYKDKLEDKIAEWTK